jgi:enoyl-CoA hydratase/carnithine racemase
MEYAYQNIRVEKPEAKIAVMSFIRPDKLNSWTNEVIDDLCDFFAKLRYDRETAVVILRGEGEKGFSAGIDAKRVFAPEVSRDTVRLYDLQVKLGEMIINMRKCPQIVIVQAFGSTVGGGMILSLAADIRLIADNVKFCLPFVKIGMGGADLGTSYFLCRHVGASVAYDMILTARYMYAEEAMRLGFASQCTTAAELDAAGMAKAQEIAQLDPIMVSFTKEALNQALDANCLEHAIILEHRNQQMVGKYRILSAMSSAQ